MAIVPGHFDGHVVPMNGALTNVSLRVGQIQQVFYPEDAKNVSKKFVEYQVLVQHRANSTGVTKMYEHCIAVDHLASIADFDYTILRSENVATKQDGDQFVPGNGAHVLLLCINGEQNNAVIIGGIRHTEGPKDVKADGPYKHFRFNGINVVINKDGELTMTYQGAMKEDGTKAEGVDDATLGTFIKLSKDGNITVSDKDGKNIIFFDRAQGNFEVTADKEVHVTAPAVRLGDAETDDPAVLGNELKGLLEKLIDQINQLRVPTSNGPSGTPLNAQAFSAIRQQLGTALSGTVFVKD